MLRLLRKGKGGGDVVISCERVQFHSHSLPSLSLIPYNKSVHHGVQGMSLNEATSSRGRGNKEIKSQTISAKNAAALDQDLMSVGAFSIDQLMELAGISVSQAGEHFPSSRFFPIPEFSGLTSR